MEAVSYIKHLRLSPKKLKTIAHEVVGLPPNEAMSRLFFLGRKSGKLLAGAIKSAMANATNNLKLEKETLRIKAIEVLKGPFFKRWQAVSRGMAHQIKKRTTHVKVTLEEVKPPKKLK